MIRALIDLATRFRRAAWRQSVETILITEHGWCLEEAVDHADLLEDIADELLAKGTIKRFPSPRMAVGSHKRAPRPVGFF